MSALFATRRDLDGWADALEVDNDDDAIAKLTRLVATVHVVDELLTEICRGLNDLPTQEPIAGLQRASGRLDEASQAMTEALRGFYVHERGR